MSLPSMATLRGFRIRLNAMFADAVVVPETVELTWLNALPIELAHKHVVMALWNLSGTVSRFVSIRAPEEHWLKLPDELRSRIQDVQSKNSTKLFWLTNWFSSREKKLTSVKNDLKTLQHRRHKEWNRIQQELPVLLDYQSLVKQATVFLLEQSSSLPSLSVLDEWLEKEAAIAQWCMMAHSNARLLQESIDDGDGTLRRL